MLLCVGERRGAHYGDVAALVLHREEPLLVLGHPHRVDANHVKQRSYVKLLIDCHVFFSAAAPLPANCAHLGNSITRKTRLH